MTKPANPFARAIDMTVKGVASATERVADMVGVPKELDVATYSQLLPEDFDAMMQTFGEGPTLDYIRVMETKLQKQ